MNSKKRFVIIDSNALLHRSFHALPHLSTKKGEQTGAVYGFLLTLFKAIKDLNPDFVVACFDFPAHCFRHEQFKEYKAKRAPTPEILVSQIPTTKKILEVFNVPIFEKKGFEADDLIATILKKIASEKEEIESFVLTADKDLLQLVNKDTKVYSLRRGLKDILIYDEEKVKERFGILPRQIKDFKALAGDASDNIPGASGIGQKTGLDLIKKFGNIKNLYRKIEEGKTEMRERIKDILIQNKKQVFLSWDLVDLNKDISISFNIKECKFGNFDPEKVREIFNKFEFFSLAKRILKIGKETKKENLKIW